MGDRTKRATLAVGAKAAAKQAPAWTALIAAIPALFISWQQYGGSDRANDRAARAEERVAVESADGYERDDKTWRYIRRLLDRHEDELYECFERIEDIEDLVTSQSKPPRRGASPEKILKPRVRPMVGREDRETPEDLAGVQAIAEDEFDEFD